MTVIVKLIITIIQANTNNTNAPAKQSYICELHAAPVRSKRMFYKPSWAWAWV